MLSGVPRSPSTPSSQRTSRLALIGVFALGLALRMSYLSAQSLSMDEIGEVGISTQPLRSVISSPDGFPPLYFILSHLWLGVFTEPASLRVLSVVFGTLTILAIWQLGRHAGGELTGITAAFLLAVSALHIYFSQEARPYSLYFLLAVLGISSFYRARATNGARSWMLYVAIAVLGLYTHYYFALLILTLLFTVLWETRSRSRERRTLVAHFAIGALAVPCVLLLRADFSHQQGYTLVRPSIDLAALGYAEFTLLAGFGIGPSVRELHTLGATEAIRQFLPWILALGTSALYLVNLALREPARRLWTLRLALLVTLPVGICAALGAALGFGFRVRYIAWCAAPLLLLLGLGAARRPRAWQTWVSLGLVVAVSAVSTVNRWTVPRYRNEDARGAASYLTSVSTAETPIFVIAGYMAGPLRHYIGETRQVYPLKGPDISGGLSPVLAAIRERVSAGRPFWLVYSRSFDGDVDGRLLRALQVPAGLTRRATLAGIEIFEAKGF